MGNSGLAVIPGVVTPGIQSIPRCAGAWRRAGSRAPGPRLTEEHHRSSTKALRVFQNILDGDQTG